MASSGLSDSAKFLLLGSLLAKDRVIPNNSKAFLKDLILRKDPRLGPLLRVFETKESGDTTFIEEVHKLLSQESQSFYDELFMDTSIEVGKALSRTERESLNLTHNKSLIYGEVDFASFYTVLRKINAAPGQVFYDLGSGTGKAVFAARITQDFSKCIGIEILSKLHQQAVKIVDRFNEKFQNRLVLGQSNRAAVFEGSFLDFDWSDGDVVFANSTCFEDDLMYQLGEQAESLKPGAIVVTFTKGLTTPELELLEKKRYKMSWGPATVFIHRRLNHDGSSVGGPNLNVLPSDSIEYEFNESPRKNSQQKVQADRGASYYRASPVDDNDEEESDTDTDTAGDIDRYIQGHFGGVGDIEDDEDEDDQEDGQDDDADDGSEDEEEEEEDEDQMVRDLDGDEYDSSDSGEGGEEDSTEEEDDGDDDEEEDEDDVEDMYLGDEPDVKSNLYEKSLSPTERAERREILMDNEMLKSQVESIARQVAHNNIRLHEIESSPLSGTTRASPHSQPKYEQPIYGHGSPASGGAKEQHKAIHSPQAMAKASPRTTPVVPAAGGDASYRSPPSKSSPFNNNWTDEKKSSPGKTNTNSRSAHSLSLETVGASVEPMGAEDAFRAMTSPQDSALMMRKRQKGKRSNKTMDDF